MRISTIIAIVCVIFVVASCATQRKRAAAFIRERPLPETTEISE